MNTFIVIFLSALSMVLFVSVGYVLVLIHSRRNIVREQQIRFEDAKRQEERYRALFEHSLVGMFKATFPPFTIVDVNSAALQILKVKSPDEFQQRIMELPPTLRYHVQDELKKKLTITDREIMIPDLGWFSLSIKMVEQDIVYGAVTNITERKEYEEKIEQQAELLNQTHDAIFVIDPDRKTIFWNKSAESFYHFTERSMRNMLLRELIFPERDRVMFDQICTDCLKHGSWSGEYLNVTADGREILTDAYWRAITTKYHGQHNILIVHTDITEKRRNELTTLRAQKLESIALLASSIAHDLQNILAPVSISIGLLKEDPKNPNNVKVLDAVEESTKHGLALVKKILGFGKSVKGVKSPVDINLLLSQTLETFAQTNLRNVEIIKNIPKEHYYVNAESEQVKQVFLNLFSNAYDAMNGKGTLHVTLRPALGIAEIIEENPHLDFEKLVEIDVTDTGAGISKVNLTKIFDPFFTTKNGDRATGLGLSIVQNIIRNHGGAVAVTSKYGHGTTFKIILPIIESEDEHHE